MKKYKNVSIFNKNIFHKYYTSAQNFILTTDYQEGTKNTITVNES